MTTMHYEADAVEYQHPTRPYPWNTPLGLVFPEDKEDRMSHSTARFCCCWFIFGWLVVIGALISTWYLLQARIFVSSIAVCNDVITPKVDHTKLRCEYYVKFLDTNIHYQLYLSPYQRSAELLTQLGFGPTCSDKCLEEPIGFTVFHSPKSQRLDWVYLDESEIPWTHTKTAAAVYFIIAIALCPFCLASCYICLRCCKVSDLQSSRPAQVARDSFRRGRERLTEARGGMGGGSAYGTNAASKV